MSAVAINSVKKLSCDTITKAYMAGKLMTANCVITVSNGSEADKTITIFLK